MTNEPEHAAHTVRAELPAVIHLPDLSQPVLDTPERKTRRRGGKAPGRHFGPRPVEDALDAWLPPIRCTAAQRAATVSDAERAGVSVNAFIRQRLYGSAGPRAQRKPGADIVLMAKVLAELGKSGSNLNQIAYHLNLGEEAHMPELRAVIAEHRAAVAMIMAALGV